MGSAAEQPTSSPRWVSPCLFALSLLVLGSTTFHVTGLAASGVTWTDGDEAYGAPGGDVSRFLPPGISHLAEGVMALALLLGPFVVVLTTLGAAWALRWWRPGRPVDLFAVGTLLAAASLVVLLALWGDELWVWALD